MLMHTERVSMLFYTAPTHRYLHIDHYLYMYTTLLYSHLDFCCPDWYVVTCMSENLLENITVDFSFLWRKQGGITPAT